MKPNPLYEKCQSADRMEVFLAVASAFGVIVSVMVLLAHGWLPSFILFFLSLIAFVLSRAFSLFASMLASIGRIEEHIKSEASKKGDDRT